MRTTLTVPPGLILPLVGLTEIAMNAGVQKPVVAAWRTRYDEFPSPVAQLHTGSVLWWPHVEQWLIRTGRQTDAGWTLEQVRQNSNGRKLG